MKTWLFIIIAAMVLAAGACSSTFMVSKGEGKRGYLGSNSKTMYDMLCASGDLNDVLETTHLSQEMKDSFYQYNCSDDRSSDKVKQLFLSMTCEQRKDVRTAFKKKGYSINGGC